MENPRPTSLTTNIRVSARELDLEPDLHRLPRHPRSLLRSVEQAHGSALAHHVHRPAGLGSPVLISGTWYYTIGARNQAHGFIRVDPRTSLGYLLTVELARPPQVPPCRLGGGNALLLPPARPAALVRREGCQDVGDQAAVLATDVE